MDNNNISTSEPDKNNQDLVLFLRELASSIEQDKMNEKQLQVTCEFKIKYKFYEEKGDEEDAEETLKYLFLGWYIYKNMNDIIV